MPLERLRQPTPDPSEFSHPLGEEMWYETEKLLDESPEVGKLQMKYIFDQWHFLKRKYDGQGREPNDVNFLTWGIIAFFNAERMNLLAEALGMANIEPQKAMREINILTAWIEMSKWHEVDRESYIGEPLFPPLVNPSDIDLRAQSPLSKVDPDNSDSPTYGHLQVLDAAASLMPIPDNLKRAVVSLEDNFKGLLSLAIESWNSNLKEKLMNKENRENILEAEYGGLALTIALSWGNDELSSVHFSLLEIYLSRLRKEPNRFIHLLSLEGIETWQKKQRRKRGHPESGEFLQYEVPSAALKESKSRSYPERNSVGSTHFAAEIDGYYGLNVGALVIWNDPIKAWAGHFIISGTHKEPPRSFTPWIILNGVNNASEALDGLIHYHKENLSQFQPYNRDKLTIKQQRELLKKLGKLDIFKLGTQIPPEEI